MPGLVIGSPLSFVGEAWIGSSDSGGTTVVNADLNAVGASVASFVGIAKFTSTLGAAGVGAAAFVSSAAKSAVLAAAGVGAFVVHVTDGQGGPVEVDLNAAGIGAAAFIGSMPTSVPLNAAGIGAAAFVSGATVSVVLNAQGAGFAFFSGMDGNAPAGPGLNNFVPIRYVVGVRPNVVPVETVTIDVAGVVPCRVFVGPANVVPVREAAPETPRVKVRIV